MNKQQISSLRSTIILKSWSKESVYDVCMDIVDIIDKNEELKKEIYYLTSEDCNKIKYGESVDIITKDNRHIQIVYTQYEE